MARFSRRTAWTLDTNALTAEAGQTRPRFDLTPSNPTTAGFRYPAEILDALAAPKALIYDPTPLGLPAAREAVSAYYGGVYSPDRILLTASTSEAYAFCFKLLCDPGDEVLIPRPSYPLFEFLAALECVHTRQYPMHYDHGWFVDLDALRRMITPRTKAIVFVNPNNPTGSYLKPAEFEAMRALGLPLIFDEVFLDYSLSGAPVPRCPADFILSGLSKISGLPQMKAGWIVCNDPEALPRLELIADTFLSVGTPVQQALPAMLDARRVIQPQILARTRGNLATLRSLSPDRLLEVEAGWCAVLRVPRTRTEDEWTLHLLRDYNVLVQPGYFYDFESEAYLVLSLLTDPEIFAEGARRTILATKC